MRLESRKLLHPLLAAGAAITEFNAGRTEADYRANEMLRAATERKFEIIGEALARLHGLDPETFAQIGEGRVIVGFRDRIIHGYDSVDDGIVWDVMQTKLPMLKSEVGKLVDQPD